MDAPRIPSHQTYSTSVVATSLRNCGASRSGSRTMRYCEVAMNEYPSMDDVALRILEVLAPIFPRNADFEQVVTALPGVSQDEILNRIDDMQKLGWVNGPLIRTGVDKGVKAVYRCHLTEAGQNWLVAEGVFD